ncbi:hypothetical protein BKA69DRAFT_1083757 [Paraphysoderma sedebokerense]|nr:hypothetical protein BKA69DRAFT_1083757 [Paraphysoderma sedebokerense]
MSDPPDSTATPSDSDLKTASPDIPNPEENGMEPTETPTTDGLDNRVIQRYPPETLLSIRSSSLCVKPDELPGIEIFVIRDPNAEAKRDRKISNRGGRPPPADGKEYKEAGKEKELKKPQIVLGPPKTAFASSQQQTTAERRGPRRDMRDGEKASPLADRRKEREIGHLGEKDKDNGKEEYRERVGGYRNREPGFGRTDKQDAKANAGRDYGRNFNEWRRDGEKGSARDYSGAADRRRNPPRDRDSYQFSQPNESTPEWMNYDPNDSSTYQSDKGLDPMQKFKLEMQQREKAAQVQSENSEDSGLDAIQQFKLQMQKSEKKDGTRMADNALDEMTLEEEHALEAGGLEDQSDYERERNPKDRMGQDEAMQETHDSKVAFSKLDAFFNTKPATPAAYAAIKSKFAGRLFQLEDEDDDDEALEPSPPRHQYPNPHDQRRIQLQQLAEQQQRQAPRPMPTDVDRQTVEADLRNFLLGGQRNSPPNHPQIQTIPMSQDSYRPYPQQQRQPSPRSAEDAQGFSKILAALAKANINGPGDSSPSDDGRSSQYRGQGYGDNRMHGNHEHPPIPHDPAIQSMSRQQQDQNLTPESARRQALLMGANVPTAVLRQLGGKVAVKSGTLILSRTLNLSDLYPN